MKCIYTALLISFISFGNLMAQEDNQLPYKEIPAYADEYLAGNVIARMIDGLGYRYYWATEGLREADLSYKPSEDGRTIEETLSHIMGMSYAILNAPQNIPNTSLKNAGAFDIEKSRETTLNNYKKASALFAGKTETELSEFKVIFGSGENQSAFPLWNLINGQISDSIYHVGQIVAFRRASGNPMNPKVNVFMGKNRP